MNKFYLILTQLYIKNYNIKEAIVNYEKYLNCIKKASQSNSPDEAKLIKNLENVLEGMRIASEELKKKHNYVKGKEGIKKIYDELINKFVYKIGVDQNSNNAITNKPDSKDESLLYEYLIKNGYMKTPENYKNLMNMISKEALENNTTTNTSMSNGTGHVGETKKVNTKEINIEKKK